ncbi:MAG: DNA translocase FtsK [Gemmatimonadota bacterium]|nr:DNA translocase FtsK [Gemmatimonadota bacterium]
MPLTPRHRQELIAIGALLAGIFVALTLLPWQVTGPVGRGVGGFLWRALGIGAALVPVYGLTAGLGGFGRVPRLDFLRVTVLFAGLIVLVPFAIAVASGAVRPSDFPADYELWTATQKLTGIAPAAMAVGIASLIGTAGAVISGVLGLSALTIYSLDWHPFRRLSQTEGDVGRGRAMDGDVLSVPRPAPSSPLSAVESNRPTARPKKRSFFRRSKDDEEDVFDELPPVSLLTSPSVREIHDWDEAIERQGDILIETLATFRVDGTIVGRTTGPVVTQYEVAPAPGVKVGRIAALADDLALAMRAQSIRIVAPIPGKGAVGVEVPNPAPRIVALRELLDASEWEGARGVLPIALGHNLAGKPIVTDLARMPHLLIAGATGSGKSICINTIITSLIYRYTPRELRLLMIDPKMVELSLYNALPHLRHPVVTDNREAAQVLKWIMVEMDRRYRLFHANGARGMADFNRFLAEGRELVDVGGGRREGGGVRSGAPEGDDASAGTLLSSPLPYSGGPLPYIVLIVDELADLMMTVQGEVEKPLAILAQKARATGIHLILATQRPSVNVITGLIKANFPCRIAFRVASKVDSRTILDQNGAEALLGNGDGLFLPPGKSEPVRFQGAYISTPETEDLTKWYAEKAKALEEEREQEGLVPEREEDILDVVQTIEESAADVAGGVGGAEGADRDALFIEAAQVCISNQGGSTSLLQRRLKIGYGRAARIMDQLEDAGILGPSGGPKGREVLIGMEELGDY